MKLVSAQNRHLMNVITEVEASWTLGYAVLQDLRTLLWTADHISCNLNILAKGDKAFSKAEDLKHSTHRVPNRVAQLYFIE
jgi:hypothetical protein